VQSPFRRGGEPVVEYRKRVVDAELNSRLHAAAAVVVEGPRASGKTETARRLASSEVLLDIDLEAQQAAELDPRLILAGPRPRLIDEWQLVPSVWNHVRRASDQSGERAQFILTGSASPVDDVTRHSGAGRISRLRMRPMSMFESGVSSGVVSLGQLLQALVPAAPDPGLTLHDVALWTCRGGWPGTLNETQRGAQRFARDYIDEIRRADVEQADGVRRDPARVLQLLRSLSRNSATEVSMRTLATDSGGSEGPLDPRTVKSYVEALERVFVIENQAAWAPQLRSRSTLRRSPKRHFVDPSLAVAALRTGPDRLLTDLNSFGLLFESLVVRDLRVYAQAHDAEVFHYRDDTGLEVDAVVESMDGSWAAFEIKLGGRARVDDAARSLLRFRDRVDLSRSGEPRHLGVITATGYAYQRPDGVTVIPIGVLGP
jgi:predicted AAA+ superfamily ATPase